MEVAQKIMADEKDRRSLSYQKIVDQTGIPKSTAERFLGLKSSNSSTVYFIVLCKLFGMSADSFFDITKESPTSQETDRAAHEIELLQLKNKYLERNNVFLRKAVEKKNLYIAVISILSLILLIRNTVMDMNDHHIGFFRGDWTPMSTAGALLIVIAAVICIVAIIANLGSRAHWKKEESKDQDL